MANDKGYVDADFTVIEDVDDEDEDMRAQERYDKMFAEREAEAADLESQVRLRNLRLRRENLKQSERRAKLKPYGDAARGTAKVAAEVGGTLFRTGIATVGHPNRKLKDILPKTPTKESTKQYFASDKLTKTPKQVQELSEPVERIQVGGRTQRSLLVPQKATGSLLTAPKGASQLTQALKVRQSLPSSTSLVTPNLGRVAGVVRSGSTSSLPIARLGIGKTRIPSEVVEFKRGDSESRVGKATKSKYYTKRMRELRRDEA